MSVGFKCDAQFLVRVGIEEKFFQACIRLPTPHPSSTTESNTTLSQQFSRRPNQQTTIFAELNLDGNPERMYSLPQNHNKLRTSKPKKIQGQS